MQRLRPLRATVQFSHFRTFVHGAGRAAAADRKNRPGSGVDTSGRTPGFGRPRGSSKPPTSSSLPSSEPSKNAQVASALQQASGDNTNNLVAPVHVPVDRHGVLTSTHPAASILANSSIVVQRQLEMMNVLVGFEQANRYIMMDSSGNQIGYLAEQEHGLGNAVARQTFRTHRSFTTHVFDKHENEVLRFHRPFAWISSRIKVYDAVDPSNSSRSSSTALQGTSVRSITDQTSASISSRSLAQMPVIGEAQQQWAPLRRKYNLFLHRPSFGDSPGSGPNAHDPSETGVERREFVQFAYVQEPFLSWDFSLLSEQNELLGSVNRNFAGFGREILTDTGVYALRMDSASLAAEPRHLISQSGQNPRSVGAAMTLDQRAVMLATAVSIDFDYFSRHSGGMGFMPLWFPWGGAAGEAAGAEAGAAGAAGAAGGEAAAAEGVATEAGLSGADQAARGAQAAARGYGAGEGAVSGAGTMAAYEAMQHGMGRGQNQEQQQQQQQEQTPPKEQQSSDDDNDWWGGGSGGQGSGGASGGGEGGGGGGLDLDDFF